jgi:hypothetical protein
MFYVGLDIHYKHDEPAVHFLRISLQVMATTDRFGGAKHVFPPQTPAVRMCDPATKRAGVRVAGLRGGTKMIRFRRLLLVAVALLTTAGLPHYRCGYSLQHL